MHRRSGSLRRGTGCAHHHRRRRSRSSRRSRLRSGPVPALSWQPPWLLPDGCRRSRDGCRRSSVVPPVPPVPPEACRWPWPWPRGRGPSHLRAKALRRARAQDVAASCGRACSIPGRRRHHVAGRPRPRYRSGCAPGRRASHAVVGCRRPGPHRTCHRSRHRRPDGRPRSTRRYRPRRRERCRPVPTRRIWQWYGPQLGRGTRTTWTAARSWARRTVSATRGARRPRASARRVLLTSRSLLILLTTHAPGRAWRGLLRPGRPGPGAAPDGARRARSTVLSCRPGRGPGYSRADR